MCVTREECDRDARVYVSVAAICLFSCYSPVAPTLNFFRYQCTRKSSKYPSNQCLTCFCINPTHLGMCSLLLACTPHIIVSVSPTECFRGGIPLPTHRERHERENEVISQTSPFLLPFTFIPHKVTADVSVQPNLHEVNRKGKEERARIYSLPGNGE